MLALTKEGQLADLFNEEGNLVIILTKTESGDRHTRYECRNMSDLEVWAICEEIALACRLRRMGNWNDPREQIDTLGLEDEGKVYVSYKSHRQDFEWTRINISYMDAEIAAMIVGEIAKMMSFPAGSVDGVKPDAAA